MLEELEYQNGGVEIGCSTVIPVEAHIAIHFVVFTVARGEIYAGRMGEGKLFDSR